MNIKNLSKQFFSGTETVSVLEGLSLEIPEGEISVLLGPSGCGKTTLLNLIGGLIEPDSGEIVKEHQELSFIFQELRLLPWMSVERNIELVLKAKISDEEIRRKRIAEVLEMVGLTPESGWYPEELSGGMRQRVSIARAFAYPSSLILMDEPFQSLDLKLRIELIEEYLKLWIEDNRTTLMVTHDVREALLMADSIHILSNRPSKVITSIKIGDHLLGKNEKAKGNRTLESPGFMELEQLLYKHLFFPER